MERVSLIYLVKKVSRELKEKKGNKYGAAITRNLDALVYIRSKQFPDINSPFPKGVSDLISQGWRSVSIMMNEYAWVIYASSFAPDFLKEIEEELILKKSTEWWYPSEKIELDKIR